MDIETQTAAGFQLAGQGPDAYERYLVPAFFTACADQLLDRVGVRPGEHLLDVACGTGIVARRAALRVGAAGSVVGVDSNAGMLAVASDLMDGADVRAWRNADATALPLRDATFDVVCCQQGLQFFGDQPRALREMHRVLAPAGRVGLAVWRSLAHHPVFVALAEALEQHVSASAAGEMRAPFAGPEPVALRGLLTDAGFDRTVVRIGLIDVRFPSTREFLRREVVSTPLAGPVGALDPARREALFDDVDRRLESHVDDDGLVVPMQTWLVTAQR